MASFEHELMPNLGVRVTGIRSIARNDFRLQNTFRPREAYNIPITNLDPGRGWPAGHGRRSGHVDHLLRVPAAVCRARNSTSRSW